MNEDIHSMLALALVAGATAIETSGKSTELFIFGEKELSYREAAILLREKAVEILSAPILGDKNTEE